MYVIWYTYIVELKSLIADQKPGKRCRVQAVKREGRDRRETRQSKTASAILKSLRNLYGLSFYDTNDIKC